VKREHFAGHLKEGRLQVLEKRAKEILEHVKFLKEENMKLRGQNRELLEQRRIARERVERLLDKLSPA